ncbi:MAG: hypothetical protein MHMPM18_000124 [Marteilia pararefringens]
MTNRRRNRRNKSGKSSRLSSRLSSICSPDNCEFYHKIFVNILISLRCFFFGMFLREFEKTNEDFERYTSITIFALISFEFFFHSIDYMGMECKWMAKSWLVRILYACLKSFCAIFTTILIKTDLDSLDSIACMTAAIITSVSSSILVLGRKLYHEPSHNSHESCCYGSSSICINTLLFLTGTVKPVMMGFLIMRFCDILYNEPTTYNGQVYVLNIIIMLVQLIIDLSMVICIVKYVENNPKNDCLYYSAPIYSLIYSVMYPVGVILTEKFNKQQSRFTPQNLLILICSALTGLTACVFMRLLKKNEDDRDIESSDSILLDKISPSDEYNMQSRTDFNVRQRTNKKSVKFADNPIS